MAEIEYLLQSLRTWGCDIDGALDRFLGEKELYQSCLCALINDTTFVELGRALQEKNVQSAFEAAHTLKGVLANLGLTPMFEVVVKLVEPLRAGEVTGLYGFYQELVQMKENLKELMELE